MTSDNKDYIAVITAANKTDIPVGGIGSSDGTVNDLARSFLEEKQSEIRINEQRDLSKIRINERKETIRMIKELVTSTTVSLAILVAISTGGYMSVFGNEANRERGKNIIIAAITAGVTISGARLIRNAASKSLESD
jgi:hypothetical protein